MSWSIRSASEASAPAGGAGGRAGRDHPGIAASPGWPAGADVFTAPMRRRAPRGARIASRAAGERARGHPWHACRGGRADGSAGRQRDHAAVIGRGAGPSCVVGRLGTQARTKGQGLVAPPRSVRIGVVTIRWDGTTGEVLAGAPVMVEAALDGGRSPSNCYDWADNARDIPGGGPMRHAGRQCAYGAELPGRGDRAGAGVREHMFFEPRAALGHAGDIFGGGGGGGGPTRAGGSRPRAVLERLCPMQPGCDFRGAVSRSWAGPRLCAFRLFDPAAARNSCRSGRTGNAGCLRTCWTLPISDVEARVRPDGGIQKTTPPPWPPPWGSRGGALA